MRLVVIGGSDAGISAGLRGPRPRPIGQVSLLVADAYPNFSICGLPYYLSGNVPDWRDLAHRTSADLVRGWSCCLTTLPKRSTRRPSRSPSPASTADSSWAM